MIILNFELKMVIVTIVAQMDAKSNLWRWNLNTFFILC